MASSSSTSTVATRVLATDTELSEVARLFDIESNDRERLATVLEALATAALHEYLLAFAGTRSPSTMRELRELRLRLLYEQLTGDAPTDAQVAKLFQLTPTQARSLIAGTRARYRTQIDKRMNRAAIDTLKAATKVDDSTVRAVMSESVAAYLRDLVAETQAPPLEKLREASRTYDVKRSTATALGKRLGFSVNELPGFRKD